MIKGRIWHLRPFRCRFNCERIENSHRTLTCEMAIYFRFTPKSGLLSTNIRMSAFGVRTDIILGV